VIRVRLVAGDVDELRAAIEAALTVTRTSRPVPPGPVTASRWYLDAQLPGLSDAVHDRQNQP
jgi:hypothetical protein